ncbi:hypothetical protein [Streptomyces sp. NBC_01237]|uniref:hypothetical protein n=1 Tax=Streptomyces sp. NBC_01237 TaxID=2903790 RepID=UPI002DDAB26A|nr:hypothetical protein [Streptomyces sp. NBC_01237]WRZ77558.1 hypothetical protein OG251_38700 [Streptomyces sp. NBC_01237]
MRTRLVLVSAARGAALLPGGTLATVQAAPAPSVTGATATSPATRTWIYVGTYNAERRCHDDGVNSACAEWERRKAGSGKWRLWMNDAS